MKRSFVLTILIVATVSCFSKVIKYKSLNYDIEKPNVEAYETKYITTYHTIDLNNNVISYKCGTVTEKYPINSISDEGTYYRFLINSGGVKNIWASVSPYNIEYEYLNGIKFIYYDISALTAIKNLKN